MSAARRRPTVLALACLLCAASVHVPAAGADGDPASDFLPSVDAYLPHQPKVDEPTAAALQRLLASAREQGHPVKVAVIESPYDLGAVTSLFGHPAAYAGFLGREIQTFTRPIGATLIVAMPAGFGIDGPDATAAARGALARTKIQPEPTSTELAASTIEAIQAIARSNGHALPPVKVPAGAGGSGARLVLVLAILAVLAAGSVAALRVRAHASRRTATRGRPGPRD